MKQRHCFIAGVEVEELIVEQRTSLIVSLRTKVAVISSAIIEADWSEEDQAWWICRCFVHPTLRNKGFGKHLMTEMCRMLDERGADSTLMPNPYDQTITMNRLVKFYEGFGFTKSHSPVLPMRRIASVQTLTAGSASPCSRIAR